MLSKDDFDRYTPDDPTVDDHPTANGERRRSRLRNILVTHGDVDNGDLDMCENEHDSTIIQDLKLLKASKPKTLAKCRSFAQAHDAIAAIFRQWYGCVRGQTRLPNNLYYAKTSLQLIIRICHLIDYSDVYERGAAQNMPSNTKELAAVKERARYLTELRNDRNFCLGIEFLRTVHMECNNLDCKCRMNYVDLLGALAFEKQTLGKRRLNKRQQKRADNFRKRHKSATLSENNNPKNNEQIVQQQGIIQQNGGQQGVHQQSAQQQGVEQNVAHDVEAQGHVQFQEISATQLSENKSIGAKKRSRSEFAFDIVDGKYTQWAQHLCVQYFNQPKQVENQQEHNQSSEVSQQGSGGQNQIEEENTQLPQQRHHQANSDEVEEVQIAEVHPKEEVKKENAIVIDIDETEDVQQVGLQMKDEVKTRKERRNGNVGTGDAASIDSTWSSKRRRFLELDAESQSRLVELERLTLRRKEVELAMKKVDAAEQRSAERFKIRNLELALKRVRQVRDEQKSSAAYKKLSKLVLELNRGVDQSATDDLVKLKTSDMIDANTPDNVPSVGSNED